MIIGLTSLFAVFYFGDFNQEEQFVTKEVITQKGQRVQVQLTDGSRIHLNAASKITYPEQFESDNRTIHLTGEAYFDINRDERPFIVYTDEVVVEILGTEFNVQAYEGEDVEVVVADGQVEVKLASNTNGESAILQRGEMARVDRSAESGFILMQGVDLQRHLGWMEYRLIFDDTPMNRVFRQLERWYGVDINYTDPAIAEMTLSANFEDEPLQAVLQVIKLALNLEYEIRGNNVTFYAEY
jgi:transmembrane sensor